MDKLQQLTLENEKWEPFPLDTEYLISTHGRVWSTVSNKILKLYTDRDGYKTFACNRGTSTTRVHRAVAMTFLPQTDDDIKLGRCCIDHINGDRGDNRVENLRWCTVKENNNFPLAQVHHSECRIGISKGPFSTEHIQHLREHNGNSKCVLQFDKDMNLIAEYISANEAARQLGLHSSCITMCCNGKIKSSGGYVWKFKTN